MKFYKILGTLLTILMLAGNVDVMAKNTSNPNDKCTSLKECDEIIGDLNSSINDIKKEEAEKEQEKQSLKDQRYTLRSKTTEIQKLIIEKKEAVDKIEHEIRESEKEIERLDVEITEKKVFVQNQMVIAQKSKYKNPFLVVIAESESLIDFIREFRMFQHFSNQANEKITDLSELVKQQQVIIDKLERDKLDIEKQQDELKAKEQELVSAMEELIAIEQALQKEIQQLQELKMEAAEIKQIMEEQRKSIIASTNETFGIPLAKGYVTCEFGCYVDKNGIAHNGIDLGNYGDTTTPVLASASGSVTRSGWHNSYGWHVMITHNINNKIYTTVYAHMKSSPMVGVGKVVAKGQQLGTMGTSGNSTGPHLHFELYEGYYNWPNSVNPRNYISFPKYW